jgi:tRNA A37 threonylcarbamoyladenosine synthetase subunit TsaC/SUA5/YrdC
MSVVNHPDSASDYTAAVVRAAQLILEGKLVAIPTETVYGLG